MSCSGGMQWFDRLQQVSDVGAARADVAAQARRLRRRPVGVGGAHDRARAGGHHEEQTIVARRAQHQHASVVRHARGVEHQVDAQRRAQARRVAAGDEGVGEWPGRADNDGRARFQPRAGLAVHERGAANTAVNVAQQGRAPRTWLAMVAPAVSASSTCSSTSRASSVWQSTYACAPCEPGAAQLRRQRVELVDAQRAAAGGRLPQRERVVERGCRCPASPASGARRGRRGTRTPPAGTGGARCASDCAAPRAPRTPGGGRRTAGSEARRGSTWTIGRRSRRRSPRASTSATSNPRSAASRAVAAPVAPRADDQHVEAARASASAPRLAAPARHSLSAMCSSSSWCARHRSGSVGHQVGALLRLRERDHVAQRLGAGQQHGQAIDARRRCRRAAARRT